MADKKDRIEDLGAEIIVTVPEGPDKAAVVAEQLQTPFPVWAAESSSPHQLYGLDRVWLGMVQRSGSVIIDGDGTVRYIHIATNPQESIDLAEVIENLRRISS